MKDGKVSKANIDKSEFGTPDVDDGEINKANVDEDKAKVDGVNEGNIEVFDGSSDDISAYNSVSP